MRNKLICSVLICLLFASSCGGVSDNGDGLAIEKLEVQVEALSQQLEKETLAEATAEEITSEETITNETAVLPDTIVTTTTETSPPTSNDGTYLQTGLLKFVNYTDIPAEFLQENANLASSKMASRNSDVIAIIYPLGRFISNEAPSYGGTFLGAEFEVVLTNDQINELVEELQDFLEQAECRSSSDIKKFTSEVKQWLEIGGGSQLQATFCPDTRVVLYSIDEDRRRDLYDIQRVFFHELYHAFQQDLGVDCETGNSSLWVSEGAADYFANYLLAEIEDRPETFAESILHPALMLSEETGKAFEDPGIAEKGMIGLRLMVERGWLDESKIIDGSLFHNCARVNEFQHSDPRIQFIKNMWYSVEEKNRDQFVFTNEALNREPDEKDFAALSNPAVPIEHIDVLIDQFLQAMDAVNEGDLFFADCAHKIVGEKVFEFLIEIPNDENLLLLEECLDEFAYRNDNNQADTFEVPNDDTFEAPKVKTIETRDANTIEAPNMRILDKHPNPQLDCINRDMDVFVDVFGVFVIATDNAPLPFVQHTAGVLAQFLDNDEDGVPDDFNVLQKLLDGNYVVPVWTEQERDDFFTPLRGTYCEDNVGTAASMYYDGDQWALGGIESAGTWDVNLEEVWHVVSRGWYQAYPASFSEIWDDDTSFEEWEGSSLTKAMDVARGGRFEDTPSSYPPDAWYTYDDGGCGYPCQVSEYFYWALVANIDALDRSLTDKCEGSKDEWYICNKQELAQKDPLVFDLLNNQGFVFPTRIPDGIYQGNTLSSNPENEGLESDSLASSMLEEIGATEPSGECQTIEQEMCWEWSPEASQHDCGPDTGASALDSEHCWEWKIYKPYISMEKTDLVFTTPNSDEEAMAQRLIDLGWNSIQSSPASYFVTSDLSDDSLEAVKSGIQAAEEYLGSYGPMRVYIIGSQTSATDAAIEDYCTWAYDPEWMERCRNDQGVGIYEIAYYMGSNAFAQHSRVRSVPTQSFVSGNPLNVGVGDGSKIAAHEYVHIYQNAHQLYDASDMFGLDIPIWIEEGSAEFLALYLADQKGWLSFRQRMEDALNEAKRLREVVPGLTIEDIADSRERVAEYCGLCFGQLQYATGQWATAWLANRTSVDSVFFDYFPSFYDLGPDGAFEDAFGLTISEFYVEFEKFMQLPSAEQMAILPNP